MTDFLSESLVSDVRVLKGFLFHCPGHRLRQVLGRAYLPSVRTTREASRFACEDFAPFCGELAPPA